MGWIAGRVYRQKITIQEGNVFADHTDFPVAIKITGANDVFTKAQSNGYDILFSNDAEEILSYERVRWDPGSQFLFVYVKTDLSSTEGTAFYMYYGNGGHTISVDPEDQTGTWDSNFYAVYHFEEASGQLQDATSNARHTTTVNTLKYRYSGLLSYSCYFDGSSDYAEVYTTAANPNRIPGDINHTYKELTVAIYCKPQATGNDRGIFSVYENVLSGGNDRHIYFDSAGNVRTRVYNRETLDTADTDWADGLWHQIVMAYGQNTGENNKIVVDGQTRVTGTASVESDFTWNQRYYFGFAGDAVNDWFHGNISEVRISRIYRSVEYLRTEYENMVNNNTFFVLGAEEDTPYLIEDIPTAVTIYDDANSIYGTRNYLTEFTIGVASTVYYDMPTDVSLADMVQTTSGTDNTDVELGLSASGILTDAELNTDVDFYVSTSGIFNTDVRNTFLDFTVGRQPVPITDPYGGVDVRNELGIGHIVTPSGYGEDTDVELGIGTTYDAEQNLDVDFSIATSALFDYLTETIASTVSGTYGWAAYRQRITISGSKIEDDLVDFPVAVHIDDSLNPVFSRAQDSGVDIKFKDNDTWLNHELVNFSKVTDELLAYVKCTLSSGIDYTFYMYYGDYGEIEDSSATWDNDFEAVYHMEEDPTGGTIIDSTEVNNATPGGGMDSSDLVNSANAALSKALDFDGNNDYLNAGTFNPSSTDLTIEFVHRMDQLATSLGHSHHVICKRTSWSPTGMMWQIHIWNNDDTIAFATNSGWVASNEGRFTYTPPATTWQYIVITHNDGGLDKLYVGGDFQESHAAITFDSATSAPVIIGNSQAGGTSAYDGKLDEMRISSVVRSPAWIKTTYNNLMDHVNFFSELGVNEEFLLCGGIGDEDHPDHWCLADHFETDVTVSGGLSYPINVDVFSSVSGTQYNYVADVYVSLANTTPSGLPQDTLISGSYFSTEVTTSGGLSYPLETDVYVSLANSVSGQIPIPPSIYHTSDYTVASGGYFSADMRLFALQIDNFFLDVDEYVTSTATMYVDITDKRKIPIDTSNCYFIIDGVTVTSGIWFTPVDRPTASGYRMYYDPPGDFVADDSTEVVVHAQNVINDWLEQTYYLLWGYNLVVNATELHSWGWDKEVVVWSTATNLARCPAESADAWHIRTAPKPFKDLAASIVPQVKHKDLSAVIYPISTAIFYDGTYKITVNLKDSAGNEMPPFTLEFTVEDKPN